MRKLKSDDGFLREFLFSFLNFIAKNRSLEPYRAQKNKTPIFKDAKNSPPY